MLELIKKEVKELGSSKQVFIGGFSQGCTIALTTYLRFTGGPLGGVVGVSGFHGANINWAEVNHLEALKQAPVLLCHGKDDPRIHLTFSKLSLAQIPFFS
jgi:phospholipase/carboxylesterase